jgi:hypothetical protein
MEIVSPTEVKSKLDKIARGEYADLIEQLPIGAAIKISSSMWSRRESIYHYFLTRYKKRVSVRNIGNGIFFVVKIA